MKCLRSWIARLLVLTACLYLTACRTSDKRTTDRLLHPAPVSQDTRIVFGGDAMLSRYVGTLARQKNDPAWPFRNIALEMSGADIAFVNLESPFSDRGLRREEGMVFKAEPPMVEGLKLAGIDVVSTANNHARDSGSYGVDYTLEILNKNGILAAGTGHTAEQAHAGVVLTRNEVRFGFLAYTYDQRNGNHTDDDDRVSVMDVKTMQDDVGAMKDRADVVVVSMHDGIEYDSHPSAHQIAFAHAAIDAGAAVVVGHHPHVAQRHESYHDGVIFYSLGNFIFDQFERDETQRGLLAQVDFHGNKLTAFIVSPLSIRQTVPQTFDLLGAVIRCLKPHETHYSYIHPAFYNAPSARRTIETSPEASTEDRNRS